jgi:hypothetical protein
MTYLFLVVVLSLQAATPGAIGTKVPTTGDVRPYFEEREALFVTFGLVVVTSGFTPMVSGRIVAYVRRMVMEWRKAQRAR